MLISKVLISTTDQSDFNFVRDRINEVAHEQVEFFHAKSIKELWYEIHGINPDVLVLSANLKQSERSHENPDFVLGLMIHLHYRFPDMPIIIHSNNLSTHLATLVRLQNHVLPIMGVMHTLDFSPDEMEQIFLKTKNHLLANKNWKQSDFASVIQNARLVNNELIKNDNVKWSIRAEAESKVDPNGLCPFCFLRICQELEKNLRDLYGVERIEGMGTAINGICERFDLYPNLKNALHESWGLRNKFVHSRETVETLDQTKFIISVVERLRNDTATF